MDEYQVQAEVIRSERLAEDIFRLTMAAPDIARTARPGQFVMVRVGEQDDPLLRRPFSIYQVTAAGTIQLLYKVLGKGTRMMAAARPGRFFDLVGPLGRGFAAPPAPARVCLVGGGMGVAPLFFLARDFLRAREPADLLVLIGARTGGELRALSGDFETLGLPMLTATDDGTAGHHGLVIDLMAGSMAAEAEWAVYGCGPYPMLRAVAGICRQRAWPCQVSMETVMACGISACLGCALPRANNLEAGTYLHVCKDGPVFAAGEVLWR